MLDCLHAAASAETRESGAVNWSYFLALCRHHRVAPLVYRKLSAAPSVPESTLAALKIDASGNAVSALRYLAETHRLCAVLGQASIAVRVLKGVPLSQAIYGDPALREVGDIDLLIAQGAEEAADRVLLAEGFHRGEPAARLTPRRRRSWQKHGKDYTYCDDHNGFEIDLHWRLFRNPHMPGNSLAGRADQSAEIRLGDMSFSVLPLDQTFLYLCVHGALDGWFRFKSLVDIAYMWHDFSSDQRGLIADRARQSLVLAEMVAALRFAQELGLLGMDDLTASLQLQAESREVRWILDYTRSQHLAQQFQPTSTGVGSWALKRYELGLGRGLAYRLNIIRRIFFRPRTWERLDLPDMLFPLYAIISPLEWLAFHRRSSPARVTGARRSRWNRWRALSVSDRFLVAEAFAALCAARFALALLPARWIFRWLERPFRKAGTQEMREVPERVRWAVLTVARYGPLSFVCFPQALAAHAMLRRRGIGSIMHYGVRRSADRQMRAHTWLEVEHRMLLGGESATLFAPIHSAGSTEP
ncbi:MAG TPA: lasso peptide biosynthesis B2 protein [Acidobacteriaceae bacterium]